MIKVEKRIFYTLKRVKFDFGNKSKFVHSCPTVQSVKSDSQEANLYFVHSCPTVQSVKSDSQEANLAKVFTSSNSTLVLAGLKL